MQKMSPTSLPATRARKRIPVACRLCKQRKVKCSGSHPCSNCTGRGRDCIFDEAEKKVTILERNLRALQDRATQNAPSAEGDSGVQAEPSVETCSQNTTDGRPPSTLTGHGNAGSARRPSPAQTGAKCSHPSALWPIFEAAASALGVVGMSHSQPPPVLARDNAHKTVSGKGLEGFTPYIFPQKELMAYLIQGVDFHLNHFLCVFDPKTALTQLESLPLEPVDKKLTRIQAKLAILVGLGKFFREKGGLPGEVPGMSEFMVARDIPSDSELLQDPVDAAETLCLLSCYADATGFHELAYIYIGHATRLLHVSQFGHGATQIMGETPERQYWISRLSISVAILNVWVCGTLRIPPDFSPRHHSSISSPFNGDEQRPSNRALQIGLGLTVIMNEALERCRCYLESDPTGGPGERGREWEPILPDSTTIMTTLRTIAQHGQEIMNLTASPMNTGITERCGIELHLWYCHSVVLVTLPSIIHMARRSNGLHRVIPSEYTNPVVWRACAKYAFLGLKLIIELHKHGFSDTYSGIKLEILAAAMLALVLVSFPEAEEDIPMWERVQAILEDVADRGSLDARSVLTGVRTIARNAIRNRSSRRQQAWIPQVDFAAWDSFDGFLRQPHLLHIFDMSQDSGIVRFAGEDYAASPSGTGRLLNDTPLSQIDAPYLDALASAGDFTFSTEDLQWLDAVQ
ncbi:uncharacterized protein F5Z01DRAFT_660486 [Emericellopsis atlantica]|uniref:Zn(2)-C6 fungal-type domain-containing protein n=1 Tax=Emericellopsis atlantica TaxID=2614577 RepID=A0A9P7ZIL4_9HYPO|nr:uncharacterized protein F5Z01DRAFT_660486 [Emericellopsis atlantica]KAG9252362.1 hypothetical protein F5Z01DRAFT_660486 [Emericellopsis atlantica]